MLSHGGHIFNTFFNKKPTPWGEIYGLTKLSKLEALFFRKFLG
jgi:hypothetical protein